MANPPIEKPTEKPVTLVVAKRNSVHASNGKVYLPGQKFETTTADAEELVKQGVALPVTEG